MIPVELRVAAERTRFMKAEVVGQPVLNSHEPRMPSGAWSREQSTNPRRPKKSRAVVVSS